MKRQITCQQERAYRFIHPDFGGLSHKQAATEMSITTDALYKLLQRMEKTAPQLFPILSAEHAEIWRLYCDEGLSCKDIASTTNTTECSIQNKLTRIKKKMGHQPQQRQIFNIDHINELQIKEVF